MAQLVVREPGRFAFAVPLSRGLAIGPDPTCELMLTDRQTSRRHAVIELDDDAWVVRDLGCAMARGWAASG